MGLNRRWTVLTAIGVTSVCTGCATLVERPMLQRAKAISEAFETFCLGALPTYESVTDKAAKRGLLARVTTDAERRAWSVANKAGTLELSVDEERDRSVLCTVNDLERQRLLSHLLPLLTSKLGRPVNSFDKDGERTYVWNLQIEGEDARVFVSEPANGGSGVALVWGPTAASVITSPRARPDAITGPQSLPDPISLPRK